MKILEENTDFSEFRLIFLKYQAKATKYCLNDHLDFIKIKNFCSSEDSTKKSQD